MYQSQTFLARRIACLANHVRTCAGPVPPERHTRAIEGS